MENTNSIQVEEHTEYAFDTTPNYNAQMKNIQNVYDNALSEIYEYNQYGQHNILNRDVSVRSGMQTDIENDRNKKKIRKNLKKLIVDSTRYQNNLINQIEYDSQILNRSFKKSADMHRNQTLMNRTVKMESNALDKKNKQIFGDLAAEQRQLEISTYYYKKNKAQLSILYYFILYTFVILTINYFSKYFSFLFTSSVHVVLIAISSAIFVVYLAYALYDIIIRDDRNFDEYKYEWRRKVAGAEDDIPDKLKITEEDWKVCDTESSS